MAPRAVSSIRLLGFRWHLLGLAAVALLPLVVFGAVLVRRIAVEERTRTERLLLENAQLLAGAIDGELAAALRALEALSGSEQLRQGDLAGFRAEAIRVDEAQPAWIAVSLLTPDGRVVVDTREELLERGAVDPATFAEVLRTRRPSVGELGRAGDRVTWAVALRAPVLVDGQVRFVLTAALSAEEIGRTIAIGTPGAVEWTRAVVDTSGNVVARTHSPDQYLGGTATPLFMDQVRASPHGGLYRDEARVGFPSVIGFSRAPLSGWSAAVIAPAALVDAPVRRVGLLLALTGLVTLLLSGTTAFLLARRFAGAVGSAADAAQALGSGGPAAVSHRGIREVALLGGALASSARLLEARRMEGARLLDEAAAARRAAEESSRAKDEFLAMLGHELRNPLSPILTALHLFRQRGSGWGREHDIISRQVGHLVRLVDDLLDVSRVTRAKIRLHLERLELAAVVARAVEMASPLLEERRHRLAVDVPRGLSLDGDPVRLAQVVSNLLTNAARYTAPGGHVRVTGKREGDRLVLEVADDGRGISPELLSRIFELFVQGPRGPDRAEGGLGIGLALVKSLVALHGGTVEARSAGPGCGSTFRVLLPAAASTAEIAPVVPLAAPASRAAPRLRVLVVDDNGDAAALLADFITRAGHDVEVAHDGPAALAAAEASPPDVVVLDLGLPVMDGYEVAAQLRHRLGAAAPAIVGVTGYGQEKDRARSHAAGFLAHLVKPAEPVEILAAVEEAPFRPRTRPFGRESDRETSVQRG